MEKTLITGVGFIGTNLFKLYPSADTLDIRDGQDICEKLPDKEYDQIFHLAAKHHIATCEVEAEECIRVNCWGTMNLIKTYPNARILLAASSSSNEIKSVYGATKAFVEMMPNLHKNCLAVKFYNVFGEHQKLEGGAVTPKLINTMLRKEPLKINGDGTQARDFTYVGDLVENLKLLMESSQTGVTHLGYGETILLNSYIEMIYGEMPEIEYTEHQAIDILRSESPIRCKQFYGRKEGMRRTIEWFKKEYNLG